MVAVLALLAMTSCNDYLDKVPDTRVYLANVEQLRQLMVDGYMAYSYAPTCELSSDNVIDNNSPDDNGVRYNLAAYDVGDNQLYAWQPVTLSMDQDMPSGVWSGAYGAISVANAVLDKVAQFEQAGVDDTGVEITGTEKEKLNAVKGEALLSRAFHHWLLVNVFCMPYAGPEKSKQYQGIPYITAPETVVKPHYERPSLAEDYELIEKDLLEGLGLVNDQLYEVPKYHFNRAAACAFAARFFLFKREYDKAEKYATDAFKGNDPATMCSTLWTKTSFYYISDIGRGATAIDNANIIMDFSNYTTWWRRFVQSGRYACNRAAKRATVQGPGPTWESCRYVNSRTNVTFAMHPAFNGYCGTAGGQEYGSYFAGNCFEQFEYTNKIAGIGYCHGVRAEFTTEETLLVRAEARLFLGKIEEAFQDLDIWDKARQNNASTDDRMVPLSHENIVKFYTKCLDKYTRNVGQEMKFNDNKGSIQSADQTSGGHYEDSIMYGIAKPIHIDEICPSDKYHVTPEIEPYLQCVQHFRRLETVHTGMRWFDIKRFGLEVRRKIGRTGKDILKSGDPRYAIQVPYEVIAAGMEATKRTTEQSDAGSGSARAVSYSQAN